jgi:methyltransferase
MTDAGGRDLAGRMEDVVRTYMAACSAADVDVIESCFVPDAIHYFPPGMYEGPFRGARTIAERWRGAVETLGSYWTVDWLSSDPTQAAVIIEWSHFKRAEERVLRGVEIYEFDPGSVLIREIRAYYASPQDSSLGRLELGGFDYAGRGYVLEAPALGR